MRANEVSKVIVAGLGAMGSSLAHHLARRGVKVVGFDRYHPPHSLGSSHGESRIIREAYFEAPVYVPLVRHAYRCWRQLEADTGADLLQVTGALTIGPADGEIATGAALSAAEHGIPHELMDARRIRRAYPQLRPPPTHVALHEKNAGVLRPEGCIAASLAAATAAGAELRFHEPVVDWEETASGVKVTTVAAIYEADALVLAAGAWMPGLLPDLALEVERQVMVWFRPLDPGSFSPDVLPVFLWQTGVDHIFYAVPDLGHGFKAARHHGGATADSPESLPTTVTDEDVDQVRDFLLEYAPGAVGDLVDTAVCRYTNTPTGHFLVGRHPLYSHVTVISACSGHGFKFASAIGDCVASELTTGQPAPELAMFGWPTLR